VKRIIFLLVLCLAARVAFAQDAELRGEVTDKTAAVIAGASVTLTNALTGVTNRTTTNSVGIFAFSGIQPGTYSLKAEHAGFEVSETNDLVIHVEDRLNLHLQLMVGSNSQTVTVNGSGLQINTTDGSVSTVIDRNFVENMPLNGRSFQDLILLAPGVVTQSPQSGGISAPRGDFSVNGQRTDFYERRVDGVSAGLGGMNTGTIFSEAV
jgi:carboxypeptidase family protein